MDPNEETGLAPAEDSSSSQPYFDEQQHLMYVAVGGSRAYGLHRPDSDYDKRGVYVWPASRHWSLRKPPDFREYKHNADAVYYEVERFMKLATDNNPNIMELLYSPLVEFASSRFQDLLDNRDRLVSRQLIPRYRGYAWSQYQKMCRQAETGEEINWKNGMHCMRLIISGTYALMTGQIMVFIDDEGTRDYLQSVRAGKLSWDEFKLGYESLLELFDDAKKETDLPEHPDYEFADHFLEAVRLDMVVAEYGFKKR